jgi:hypothetical protein
VRVERQGGVFPSTGRVRCWLVPAIPAVAVRAGVGSGGHREDVAAEPVGEDGRLIMARRQLLNLKQLAENHQHQVTDQGLVC